MTDPFIPGTHIQWAWDSTSLGWFKECPRKYYYHMIEGFVPRDESIHLRFGILYHSALEHYDTFRATGLNHEAALLCTVRELMQWTWVDGRPWRASKDLDSSDRTSLKCREFLVRTVVWYCDKFKDDPAKTRISRLTGKPMVELHFQFELDYNPPIGYAAPYTLCGHLDRVVTFQDEPYGMDRKTTTNTITPHYFDQYDPDNQISLYTLACQVAFHTPVKGIIIDAAQIAVGFSRFGRSFVMKTSEQVNEWLKDLKVWLDQAYRYAESNYWPQNDKSCQKYGGCPFRSICNKSPVVRDKFLESSFVRRAWNPLIPRSL